MDAGDTSVFVRQAPAGTGLVIEICTKTDAEHAALAVTLDGQPLHPAGSRPSRRLPDHQLPGAGSSRPRRATTTPHHLLPEGIPMTTFGDVTHDHPDEQDLPRGPGRARDSATGEQPEAVPDGPDMRGPGRGGR